jgi:hypothetical protein
MFRNAKRRHGDAGNRWQKVAVAQLSAHEQQRQREAMTQVWVGPLKAQLGLRSSCHTSSSPTETCKTVQILSSVSLRIEVQLLA